MRIKRLEILGFKSFADRAVIDFDSGVTGVVGPNGCGKSNIVDALRWVMGEQNARHLRGGQMQDIIFNGSQNKSPLGYAEVTLTLENDGEGAIPNEYANFSEIQIARRLYRTGDSEYEINKRPCRLKDITDLFLGTGVGTRAYSIIEQGRVSAIVQAKPEERRQMIEEAAGITKYKSRRAAAERKMQNTQHNLMRISDVKKEVEGRLESLEKQAKKAERYHKLQEEIVAIDKHYGALQFLELSAQGRFLEHQEAAKTKELEEVSAELSDLQENISKERDDLLQEEKSLSLNQAILYEAESAISLTKQDIGFLNTSLESKKRQSLQMADEIVRLKQRYQDLFTEKERMLTEQAQARESVEGLEERLFVAQEALSHVQDEKARYTERLQVIQRALSDFAMDAANKQSTIQTLQERGENAQTRIAELQEAAANLKKEEATLQEQVAAAQQETALLLERREDLLVLLADMKEALSKDNDRLKELQTQQKSLESEAALASGRLQSLQDIEESYEWSSEGVTALMKEEHQEHIIGLLADFIEAPAELETLVEDVLRQHLETLLVHKREDVFALTTWLRKEQSGRVRFFSKERDKEEKRYDSSLVPGYRLLDRLQIFDGLDALVQQILGHIFVVEGEAAALNAWPMAQKTGLVLVTQTGSVFESDGSITGGVRSKTSGVLGRKREIRELSDSLERYVEQERLLQSEIAACKEHIDAKTQRFEALRLEEQQAALALVRSEETLTAHKRDAERMLTQAAKFAGEIATLQDFIARSATDLQALRAQWQEALDEHEAREEALRQMADDAQQFEARLAAQSEETTHLRIQVASTKERLHHLDRSLEQLANNSKDIGMQLESLERQERELSEEQVLIAQRRELAEEKLEKSQSEHGLIAQKLGGQRQAYDERAGQVRIREQHVEAIRKNHEAMRAKINELVVQKETLRFSINALHARLRERYELSAHELLLEHHALALPEFDFEQKLSSLRRSIDQMGPVNPNAVNEYTELKERYDFLHSQSEDLANALGQLDEAIKRIDETTHRRFSEAFEAINNRFSQVFPRLFRGGKAWLALTQPEDLLNTGVEIFAQPPGKKLGSIVLMSGGEKALTAISLIFAIFLIKPSPFCLLDEVDAPLDEANVERFSQLVKEMSNLSQFIVITHNKRTMEIVDQIYGITMEEPGASRTVSVKVQGVKVKEATEVAAV